MKAANKSEVFFNQRWPYTVIDILIV